MDNGDGNLAAGCFLEEVLKLRYAVQPFYVQEVRYAAGAWMRRSGDVQEVRYAAGAWMRRSGDVQEVRYAAGAWMRRTPTRM